jgi:hypothetical protein
VPWVPVVEVSLNKEVGSIAIRVRHPEVPVEVVAAVYKDRRRELGGRTDTYHRITSGWPGEVFDFVTAWSESHPGLRRWERIFAAFRKRHRKAPYSTLDSFRETFYREQRRRKASDK